MPKSKVIILAGGQGMRLREETEYRPKPMVEVGGRPILWHIMKHYSRFGHREFVVCLGYKGEKIKEYFLNFEFLASDFTITVGKRESIVCHDRRDEHGWQVTLANTGPTSETGSRIKQIQKYAEGAEILFLTYGDGVASVDLHRLAEFHRSHGRVGTVTGVSPPSRFGELMSDNKQVKVFSEKPQVSQGFINGGFFAFDHRLFDYVTADPTCNFERGPLQKMAAEGQLMMYEHTGFWQCVDTMRDLVQLNQMWNGGKAPWVIGE